MQLIRLTLLGAMVVFCVLPAAPGLAKPLPAKGTVEVLFSPWDDAEGAILRTLDAARRSIHVQAYLLTSRTITKALIEAHRRGVKVEVLADREMVEKGDKSLVPKLVEAGIPVALETRYNVAHNKVLIIDADETKHAALITGSYNFTWSAQARNAENLLIFRGNAPLVKRYMNNWRRHRDDATPWHGEKLGVADVE